MADPRAVEDASSVAQSDPARRRALVLRANAPQWLRALALLAFSRAAAIIGVAWFWTSHRDEEFGETWIIAWAVCAVAFELCAAVTLLVTARGRVPAWVAVTLGVVAFGHLSLCVILFVGAGGFGGAPEWALAWGLFDNLVRLPSIVGVLWPAILARARAIEARSGEHGA